jgi:hypothetical protein
MDKLDAKQTEQVKKLSSARLIAKLAQAGCDEDELEAISREQLMNEWDEHLSTGTDGKAQAKAETITHFPF